MSRYLLFLSFFGSIALADTLPMNQHTVPEQYKINHQYNSDEEMIKVSLSETEFHMILDALKIASDSIHEKDPYYANKLRNLRYELLPDFEE